MASPQLEDGFTRLANELIDALMRTNLSAYQSRILWAIWRETYGFHKKEDWISNSQLSAMTGIRKQHVSRTIKELIGRNTVTKAGYKVSFNKDYTQWRELPKQVTVTNSGYKVTSTGVKSNQFRGTQKKKVLKKVKIVSKDTCPHQSIINLYHEYLPMCPPIVKWTPNRAKNLRARWNESPDQKDLEWWEDLFRQIAQSKFLTGRTTGKDQRPFFASLDWIVKPDNLAKILEGKYHE